MLCRVVASGSSSFASPSFLVRRSIDRMMASVTYPASSTIRCGVSSRPHCMRSSLLTTSTMRRCGVQFAGIGHDADVSSSSRSLCRDRHREYRKPAAGGRYYMLQQAARSTWSWCFASALNVLEGDFIRRCKRSLSVWISNTMGR